jgi:PAS domain-containing protein
MVSTRRRGAADGTNLDNGAGLDRTAEGSQMQDSRTPTSQPRAPTGIERFFDREEIIVSKTDTRGQITYANDVFLRVAGYTEAGSSGSRTASSAIPTCPAAFSMCCGQPSSAATKFLRTSST